MISEISSHPVIQSLESSDYHFFLTGARFFRGGNADSPWEFFTRETHADSVINELKELGFNATRVYGAYPETICVYRYEGFEIQVDIWIIATGNLEQCAQIQQALAEFYPKGFSSKEELMHAWRFAHRLLNT